MPLVIERISLYTAQVPHGFVGSIENVNTFQLSTLEWHFGPTLFRTLLVHFEGSLTRRRNESHGAQPSATANAVQ
jgi:hypothetical protein